MAGSRVSSDDDEDCRSASADLFPWRKELASLCTEFGPQLPVNAEDFDAAVNEYLKIDLKTVKDPFEINYAQLIQITISSADKTSFLVTGCLLELSSKLFCQQVDFLLKTCKRFADEISRHAPEKKKSNRKEAEDLNRGEVQVEEPGCSQDSGYGSQQLPTRNEKSSLAKTIKKFIADEKQIGMFGDSTSLGSAIISQRRNLFQMFKGIANGTLLEADLSPYYSRFFKLVKDHVSSSSPNTNDESLPIEDDQRNQDASSFLNRLRRHCFDINQAPGIPFSLSDLNEETQTTVDDTGYNSLLDDDQEGWSENRLEISENVEPHLASNAETDPPENIDSLAEGLLSLLSENDNNEAKRRKGIKVGSRKRRLQPLQQLNAPEMLLADDLEPAMKRATLFDESVNINPDSTERGAIMEDRGYVTVSPFSETEIDGELALDLSRVSLDGDFRIPSPLFDSSASLLGASKSRTSTRVDMEELIQQLHNTLKIMEEGNERTEKIPLTTLLYRSKINIAGVSDDNSTQGASLGVAILGIFHVAAARKWYLVLNKNNDIILTKTKPKDQQPPPGHVSKPGQL